MIALLKNLKAEIIFVNASLFFLGVLFSFIAGNLTMAWLFFSSVILFSAAILLVYVGINQVYKLFIFLIPFSVALSLGGGTEVMFPSEPITGLLALTTLLSFFAGAGPDRKFFTHPISILIIFYLFFLLVSAFYSAMPFVSAKAFVVRLCYILAFYFLLNIFLRRSISNIGSVYLLYGISLSILIIVILFEHAAVGFSKDSSGYVTRPFFSDHTIYSACLAMVLPALIFYFFYGRLFSLRSEIRILLGALAVFFLVAVLMSFCRATWISLLITLIFFLVLKLRIKFFYLLTFLVMCVAIALVNKEGMIESFRQNKYNSNDKHAGIEEQTRSITNISNDVSNAERLNRWSCAVRMFKEKPLTGFGVGTYQFEYLPFQLKDEMTRISVTSPYNIPLGKGGSAHSEYLLVLSESGVFGLLFFVLILMYAVYTGMDIAYNCKDEKFRLMAVISLLSITTYIVHSFFNNFLDTDKAAFLFWGSICVLVTIRTHYMSENKKGAIDPAP